MAERLSANDAAFLYAERAGAPLHVGGVVILEPGPGRVFDHQDLADLVDARLALVPRYRRRVRSVPGRIGRPVWVDDDHFDLDYHVRRSALPAPGSEAQLNDLVGRLISRPLDRNRPLWELYVIEGLAGGRVALVNKTHPALVDRLGAVDIAAAVLDETEAIRDLPEQPWVPTPPPSDPGLVYGAVLDLLGSPGELAGAARLALQDVRGAVGRAVDVAGQVVDLGLRVVRPAPRTLRGSAQGGARTFASATVDLDSVRSIRAVRGGTVNDVVMAVIAGALRSFLLALGEPVTASSTLRALVPVSVRTGGDTAVDPVVSHLLDLPVAEPNPTMRLRQISFAMAPHTESGRQLGAPALLQLGRFAPPTLHALGARVAGGLSTRAYDLLITNVPGPREQLFAAGHPVTSMVPVAPLVAGQALSLAVTSYHGHVHFGVTADRQAVGDAARFTVHVADAVEELMTA